MSSYKTLASTVKKVIREAYSNEPVAVPSEYNKKEKERQKKNKARNLAKVAELEKLHKDIGDSLSKMRTICGNDTYFVNWEISDMRNSLESIADRLFSYCVMNEEKDMDMKKKFGKDKKEKDDDEEDSESDDDEKKEKEFKKKGNKKDKFEPEPDEEDIVEEKGEPKIPLHKNKPLMDAIAAVAKSGLSPENVKEATNSILKAAGYPVKK